MMIAPYSVPDFIAKMPKAELHVHVEGTIEGEDVLLIAERNGIDIPFKTPDEIRALQSQSIAGTHNNLDNFLKCLDISRGVLRRPEDWYDIALTCFRRCDLEKIVYVEIMVDPQQAIRQGVEVEACLEALVSASQSARDEYGVQSKWIANFQRDHPPEEALDLLPRILPFRDQVVAIGLDNFETPGFPQLFAPVFRKARQLGFHLTSHCDVNQANTLMHISDCLHLLKVERIDHGLNVADDFELTDFVIDREIPLTACPSFYSSMQTMPIDRMERVLQLYNAGALISLNSDDPAQFGSGYLSQTLASFQEAAKVDDETMIGFMANAFRSAWMDESERRDYLTDLEHYLTAHSSP